MTRMVCINWGWWLLSLSMLPLVNLVYFPFADYWGKHAPAKPERICGSAARQGWIICLVGMERMGVGGRRDRSASFRIKRGVYGGGAGVGWTARGSSLLVVSTVERYVFITLLIKRSLLSRPHCFCNRSQRHPEFRGTLLMFVFNQNTMFLPWVRASMACILRHTGWGMMSSSSASVWRCRVTIRAIDGEGPFILLWTTTGHHGDTSPGRSTAALRSLSSVINSRGQGSSSRTPIPRREKWWKRQRGGRRARDGASSKLGTRRTITLSSWRPRRMPLSASGTTWSVIRDRCSRRIRPSRRKMPRSRRWPRLSLARWLAVRACLPNGINGADAARLGTGCARLRAK